MLLVILKLILLAVVKQQICVCTRIAVNPGYGYRTCYIHTKDARKYSHILDLIIISVHTYKHEQFPIRLLTMVGHQEKRQ